MIWPFAPENQGGKADYRPRVIAAAKDSDRDVKDIAEEVSWLNSIFVCQENYMVMIDCIRRCWRKALSARPSTDVRL